MAYSCVYEFDTLLEKVANPSKRKRCVGLVCLRCNAINKIKIETKPKNDMIMLYIIMAIKTNSAIKHVDKGKSAG